MKVKSDLRALVVWLSKNGFRRIKLSQERRWFAYSAPEGCNIVLLVPVSFGFKNHPATEQIKKATVYNIVRILNMCEEDPKNKIEDLFRTLCQL